MNVLISGGGIAGLTLALCLHRHGHQPLVVERSPHLRDEGYMIDFCGAGYDASERMSILADLEGMHYQIPRLAFLDRFGWDNMVATVAGVYQDLPAEERAESCVFTGNYGEAGAVDFLGPRYDLPKAISGHNNYHLWGPGSCTGEVVISVGVPLGRLEAAFEDIEQADTIDCEYCMPDEDNLPVYIGRNPKASLQEIWPQVKHYD